ncbi:MAG: NINE protein [Proteobacteria bacterium]|nr:NINE protein [Pseudomonadota bacterium]
MKSKTTAALLALFLGGLGIHRFYLGKGISGVLYIVFCWTLVPAIFGFIEGLNFLLMSEAVFNQRYNKDRIGFDIQTPETHIKCPDCAELIRKEARVCKHCGCKLIPS